MIKDAYKLTATEALSLFASGKLTSVELVKSCLAQITATDGATYALYADPNGKDEASGLPILYAWYIHKS